MASPWLVHVDGTAVPSPGALGVGVVLVGPDGARHEVSRALEQRGCNNEAEEVMAGMTLDRPREPPARRR